MVKNKPLCDGSHIDEELPEELKERLRQFLSTVGRNYPVAKIIMALDPPTTSLKNFSIYSGYKQNRNKKAKEEVYSCFNDIVKFLNISLGSNYFFVKAPEYEADQVIASLCDKYHETKQILVYSGDKDLLQLTALNNVYSSEKFEKGEFLLRTDLDIFRKFKNTKGEDFTRISNNKRDILKYRALKGDSSDNIPPVFPRIKDSEISKIITEYWISEEKLSKEYIDNMIDRIREDDQTLANKLEAHSDNWIRNYEIMNLYGLKDLQIKRVKK